jgi:hypothetical protein
MNKTFLALLQAILPAIMQFVAELIQKLADRPAPAPEPKLGRPKKPKTATPDPTVEPLTK